MQRMKAATLGSESDGHGASSHDQLSALLPLAVAAPAPAVDRKNKRRLLDAIPSPPSMEDRFTLRSQAAVSLAEAAPTCGLGGVTTDMIWYELLEEG
ncbi:hypothetical protein ZWY2020_052969 [Hordeum vulgare]|nr:hypothetical protein ZWY2020_052969 [Hordeum vulgare]